MKDRTPKLPADTYVMIGTIDRAYPDMIRHKVFTFTREQFDPEALLGFRAEWIIIFGDYDQEWLDTTVKPFLVAAPEEEILAAQRGEPIKTRPALWHVPNHIDLYDRS